MKAHRKITESIDTIDITVLLIEDSLEDGVAITKAFIESETFYDFRIIRKYTLEGGLTFLKTARVDIVLLDLGLPDARELKAVNAIHNLYPEMPIVIISGYSNVDMIHAALQNGAQEFLIKGESSSAVIRQSMYQAIARKKIELAYQKGDRI
jgi:DNA-binding NarL/FixJ family response regulator